MVNAGPRCVVRDGQVLVCGLSPSLNCDQGVILMGHPGLGNVVAGRTA